jgi:hypothetical protein
MAILDDPDVETLKVFGWETIHRVVRDRAELRKFICTHNVGPGRGLHSLGWDHP